MQIHVDVLFSYHLHLERRNLSQEKMNGVIKRGSVLKEVRRGKGQRHLRHKWKHNEYCTEHPTVHQSFSHTLSRALSSPVVSVVSSHVHSWDVEQVERCMATIRQVCNNSRQKRRLSLRSKMEQQSNWDLNSLLFMAGGVGGASLLTCTIKASFAKRKCSSLFSGGQKAESVFSMGAASFTRVGLVIGCATTRGTFVTRTDTVTLENARDKSDNFAWWLHKEGHTF